MPKRIIILEATSANSAEPFVRYAMWIPIPAAYQAIYANSMFTSAFKGISSNELLTLQAGSSLEVVDRTQILPSWTLANVKTELIRNYSLQTVILAAGSAIYLRYGVSWDGTTWSA